MSAHHEFSFEYGLNHLSICVNGADMTGLEKSVNWIRWEHPELFVHRHFHCRYDFSRFPGFPGNAVDFSNGGLLTFHCFRIPETMSIEKAQELFSDIAHLAFWMSAEDTLPSFFEYSQTEEFKELFPILAEFLSK